MALRIIDVSEHNQKINWEQARNHIDGAILRCGYGMDMKSQDDLWWKYNADECTRLGIPFGTYLYSYADTDTKSRSEAAHVLRLIKGYKLSYPVYLDLEEEHSPDTRPHAVRGARIFADILEAAGYQVGIYANESWYKRTIGGALDKYTKWVAKYSSKAPDVPDVDIWQYTSSGSVPGLIGNGGRVDVNHCYRDFAGGCTGGGAAATVPDKTNTDGGKVYMFGVREIGNGDYGNDVLLAQEILGSRGYYTGELDKGFGPLMVAATKRYQSDRKGACGAADGIIGKKTWQDMVAL